MAKIQKYFSVVVTYSKGNYDKVDAKLLANITLLKITESRNGYWREILHGPII